MLHTALTFLKIGVCGDGTLCILPDISETDAFLTRVSDSLQNGLVAGRDKMGISHRVFDAVFLGRQPYPVAGTTSWAFSPTLGRRLYKHHVMRGDGNPYAWLHGVAKMEVRCFKHVPVLYEQAKRVCELLSGRKATPYKPEYEYGVLTRAVNLPEWDMNTILYLANGYGTTVDYILARVQDPFKATALPWILGDHDVFMVTDAC